MRFSTSQLAVANDNKNRKLLLFSFIAFPLDKISNNWKTFLLSRHFLYFPSQSSMTIALLCFYFASRVKFIYFSTKAKREGKWTINKKTFDGGKLGSRVIHVNHLFCADCR